MCRFSNKSGSIPWWWQFIIKPQIEKSPEFKYIEFIEDVRANAVGYEKITAMRSRRR